MCIRDREVTMQHLKEDCITPVFAKDNELTIPHPAFIDTVYDAANTFFLSLIHI